MGEILRTILIVFAVGVTIVFLIWLFYGNGINIIKAKTNEAVKGEPFDKNGENVRSWASDSELDCKRDCMWDTREENPIYIWEETNRTNHTSYLKCSPLDKNCSGEIYTIIEGRCYCKY
jgi:hypothetical protein